MISTKCVQNILKTRHGRILNRSFFNNSYKEFGRDEQQQYVIKRKFNASPQEVYDVVSEVSKYQEFIPYCEESFVNKRDETGKPVEAGLRVGFKQYDEKFVCKVNCQDVSNSKKVVTAESLSHNLFNVLHSKWTITAHPGYERATEVELLLRFQFKSKLYNSVSFLFAKSVTDLVLKAFDRRVFRIRKEQQLR